jgi:hypothetical protein
MGDMIKLAYLDCNQKGQLLMRMLKNFLTVSVKQYDKEAKKEEVNKDLI